MINFGQNLAAVSKRFADKVNVERAKRLEYGTIIDLPGYGPVELQGRPEDQSTLMGLAQNASFALQAGLTPTIPFMARDNTLHQLSAQQVITVFQLGSEYVSAVYSASFALKAQADKYVEVSDDSHWPSYS